VADPLWRLQWRRDPFLVLRPRRDTHGETQDFESDLFLGHGERVEALLRASPDASVRLRETQLDDHSWTTWAGLPARGRGLLAVGLGQKSGTRTCA